MHRLSLTEPERRPAVSPSDLLVRAGLLFDAPGNALVRQAAGAWRRGFASGGQWMGVALQAIRQESSPRSSAGLQWLGIAKYAMALAAGMLFVVAAAALHRRELALLGIAAFYAVEAQMVFLFPLALDGRTRLFRESRRWTRRAGGTFAVLRVVLPLAAVMVTGGFIGRGFVRSWCLGCLAICIWYEDLRRAEAQADGGCQDTPDYERVMLQQLRLPRYFRGRAREGFSSPRISDGPLLIPPPEIPGEESWMTEHGGRSSFEFGTRGPLHLRRQRVECGLVRPITLLYASDLHLGWRWSNPVISQLLASAVSSAPDAILLGGDLADRKQGLASLGECVAALAKIAPVYAIPGNHDHRPGVEHVRAAVKANGGMWLADAQHPVQLRPDLLLSARPQTLESASPPHILCAHDPAIFPAACRGGYRLVLAGHLHGGQCVLATRRGRLLPGAWFARWTGLRFVAGPSTMLVSRGAADTLPFRWNCPREVIVCEIV
jgi:predicted MPP superfamily phosphohydrolase